MIVEVGPGVTNLTPGDHVVLSFIPACGRCPSCAIGQQHLCDLGAFHSLAGNPRISLHDTTPSTARIWE